MPPPGPRPRLARRRHEALRHYVEAVDWAQDYALANRREMMDLVVDAVRGLLPVRDDGRTINCHHN